MGITVLLVSHGVGCEVLTLGRLHILLHADLGNAYSESPVFFLRITI